MKILLVIITLLFFSCTKEPELNSRKLGKLIATVDTNSIYDSTLIEQYPFLSGSNDYLKIGFVDKWINKKLILKKIYADKFNEKESIKEELQKLNEDFLIAKFLKSVANKNKIPKEQLEVYYANNISDFLIPEDEYKYQLIYFDTKDNATDVHKYMTTNKMYNFNTIQEEYAKLIVQTEIVGNFTKVSNINSKDVNSELSKLKIGGFSKPIKYEDNYIIIKLVDKRVKGNAYPFIEVEGKIMLQEYGKYETKIYHEVVDSMKLFSDVKVYINGDVND